MTTVLVAVEAGPDSVDAVRVAHRMFGDAQFVVVNVDERAHVGVPWGFTYPIMMPVAADTSPLAVQAYDEAVLAETEHARRVAADVAASADVPHARPVGETGDPAQSIIDAAQLHHADVIVVGSHDHGWLSRLFARSVSGAVVRGADVPVLVVK